MVLVKEVCVQSLFSVVVIVVLSWVLIFVWFYMPRFSHQLSLHLMAKNRRAPSAADARALTIIIFIQLNFVPRRRLSVRSRVMLWLSKKKVELLCLCVYLCRTERCELICHSLLLVGLSWCCTLVLYTHQAHFWHLIPNLLLNRVLPWIMCCIALCWLSLAREWYWVHWTKLFYSSSLSLSLSLLCVFVSEVYQGF